MQIEDKDLSLSTKYQDYQYVLDLKRTNQIKNYKQANSDTVEAAIILNDNIDLFKVQYQNKPFLHRRIYLLEELRKQFPNLSEKQLSRYLTTQGFYTEAYFIWMYLIVSTGVFLLLNTLAFTFANGLDLILTLGIEAVVNLACLMVTLNVLNNKDIPSYRIK